MSDIQRVSREANRAVAGARAHLQQVAYLVARGVTTDESRERIEDHLTDLEGHLTNLKKELHIQ